MMRVGGAVGNRVRCGFPRSGGRVLCVHGSGSVHAPNAANGIECLRRAGHLFDPHGKALLKEQRELRHRLAPRADGHGPAAGDVAQREPQQFRGRFSVGKWPRVLMILRSRAWTLSRALVV
jgi:hypothetical protein